MSALFPACVIPGCKNPVADVGTPCGECRNLFGDMLAENTGAHRMTEQEIADRDDYVSTAYAGQRSIMRGSR